MNLIKMIFALSLALVICSVMWVVFNIVFAFLYLSFVDDLVHKPSAGQELIGGILSLMRQYIGPFVSGYLGIWLSLLLFKRVNAIYLSILFFGSMLLYAAFELAYLLSFAPGMPVGLLDWFGLVQFVSWFVAAGFGAILSGLIVMKKIKETT